MTKNNEWKRSIAVSSVATETSVGLVPPNKAPRPKNWIWNTINQWNSYQNFNVKPPCTNAKLPVEDSGDGSDCCANEAQFLWLLPLHGAFSLWCRKDKAFCEQPFASHLQQPENDKQNISVANPWKNLCGRPWRHSSEQNPHNFSSNSTNICVNSRISMEWLCWWKASSPFLFSRMCRWNEKTFCAAESVIKPCLKNVVNVLHGGKHSVDKVMQIPLSIQRTFDVPWLLLPGPPLASVVPDCSGVSMQSGAHGKI